MTPNEGATHSHGTHRNVGLKPCGPCADDTFGIVIEEENPVTRTLQIPQDEFEDFPVRLRRPDLV